MELTLIIPSVSSLTLKIISQRGIDDVDDFEMVNPISRTAADGTMLFGSIGFRRRMTVNFGYVKDRTSRMYLVSWLRANDRQIVYGGETISVSVPDLRQFMSQLLHASKYFRSYSVVLVDRVPLTSAPVAWGAATGGIYTSDGKLVITSDGEVVHAHS